MPKREETKQFGTLTREASIVAGSVNVKSRTVELAFSSEHPVRRGGFFTDPYDEVLDHSPSSVRLGRFNGGAANLLMHHNSRDIVGIIESASIDSDRRGRAVARLGKGERASEVLRDAEDGILVNVSVGYQIHEGEMTRGGKGETDLFRAFDWEPVEASFVGVGADPNAGIGRAAPLEGPSTVITYREGNTMPKEKNDDQGAPAPADVTLSANAGDQLRQAERARIKEITALGAAWGHVPDVALEADRAIDEGKTVDQFRANIMPILQSQNPAALAPKLPEDKPRTLLGMSDGQADDFSIIRAIRAVMCMRGMDTMNDPRKIAPFEIECSNAVADELGVEARGILVPYDVQQRTGWGTRTVPMGVATTGTVAAALKGTELLASSFIEALNSASVALQAGMVAIPGLVGDVDIPKQTGQAAWTWLAEDADGVDTEVAIGSVSLVPHTISGPVPITRKLLKQSTPAVEQIVRNDLVIGAARTIDLGALSGAGTGAIPLGIRGQTGVNTQTLTASGTFAQIVGMETAVGADNALSGSAVYMMPWAHAGTLKTTVKDAGSGQFVFQDGMINGYRCIPTSQLVTDERLFGSFNQALLGMWGVLDINVDTATKAASGGIVLRPFQDVDIGVRHAEAFCIEA